MKIPLAEKVLNETFDFNWDRRMSYEKIRLFDHAIQFDLSDLTNIDLGLQIYRVKNGVVSHWRQKVSFDKFMEKLIRLFNDPEYAGTIKKYTPYIRDSLGELKRLAQREDNYSKLSDEDLLSHYDEFCEFERRSSFMNHLLFMHLEKALTTVISGLLPDKIQLDILSLQTKEIPIDAYHRDICLHILGQISFRELYHAYMHIGLQDVFGSPLSEEALRKDIDSFEDIDVNNYLKDLEDKYNNQRRGVKEVLESWKKNEHVHALLSYFCLYSNEKEWKNFFRERSTLKLSRLLEEMGKRKSWSVEEISYLTAEEKRMLFSGDMENLEVVRSRKEDCMYLIYKNKIEVITDKEILSLFDMKTGNSFIPLKGNKACGGKVRGRVSIILSNEDFHKFEEGDVLVAPTTRPEFVPIMDRASAIVTNEGGILSHAAILSRELEIPCIVGTDLATKVLRDGDIIEVDADNGVVNLIERKDNNLTKR